MRGPDHEPGTSQGIGVRIGGNIVDTGGVVSGVSVRIGSFTGHIIVHTQPTHASMPQCNTKLLKLIDILNSTFLEYIQVQKMKKKIMKV